MNPEILVISLDNANGRTRMQRMKTHLDDLGLPFRVIRGVHGKQLSVSERHRVATSVCSTMCTPSTIGCGASHAIAWKHAMKSGHPYTIIIEDDTEFDDDVIEHLRIILPNIPGDADVVMLGCFLCATSSERVRPHAQNIQRLKQFSGTHAYIVTQKGARTLLRHAYPVKFHLDMTMSFLSRVGTLKAYSVTHDIARQSSGMDTSENVGDIPGFPGTVYAASKHIHDGKGQSLFFYLAMPIVRVGPYRAHVTLTGLDFLVFLVGALGLRPEIFVSALVLDRIAMRSVHGVLKAITLFALGHAINVFAARSS